ncbi:MAG: nitrilase family protein [Flavobacteriaceae bacterium]|jgi:predicted amidohydrolase|nr:nitrilase family protein [Flavobacteriaceae bacterium]MDG2314357.1 nitrilase family protein [Flavobacteriaceae bacterium]
MNSELHIAVLQPDIRWHNPQFNLQYIEKQISEYPKSIDLWVLPELFSTGFTMQPHEVAEPTNGATILWMQQTAAKFQTAIAGSIVIQENTDFFNRFVMVQPNGTMDYYDKKHPYTPSGEGDVYKAGTQQLCIEYKGWRIRPLICYDLRFPVWARNTDDYDVLLVVANWPKARIQAWNALLRARAIENMAYAIGVNRIGTDHHQLEYPGHSAVYDALGNEVLLLDANQEVGVVSIDKSALHHLRKKLPFLEDSDAFSLE